MTQVTIYGHLIALIRINWKWIILIRAPHCLGVSFTISFRDKANQPATYLNTLQYKAKTNPLIYANLHLIRFYQFVFYTIGVSTKIEDELKQMMRLHRSPPLNKLFRNLNNRLNSIHHLLGVVAAFVSFVENSQAKLSPSKIRE